MTEKSPQANLPTNNPAVEIPDLTQELEAKVDDSGVVWITRERMLETAVLELTAERDFLRQLLLDRKDDSGV